METVKKFHFGDAHFCAGCPCGNESHIGCVVNGDVEFQKNPVVSGARATQEQPIAVDFGTIQESVALL